MNKIIVKNNDLDQKHIMTKVLQKVEKKAKQIEKMSSRQRFDFEKKKIKIIKNVKNVQKIALLSS